MSNMNSRKKTLAIQAFCVSIIVVCLVAVPILFAASAGAGEADGADGAGFAPYYPLDESLDQLPSSPEEAHQRLLERETGWPAGEGGFAAAAAAQGVQSGVRVTIPYDSVEGFITHPGANVRVELFTGAVLKQTVTRASGADGWFKADLSTGDIVSGDTVVVTDLGGGAAATIDCTLTGNMDFANDRVHGNAAAGNLVDVYIVSPSTYYADVPPGAAQLSLTAAGGAYNAVFTAFDLRNGDAAMVYSTDAAGHMVMDAAAGSGMGLVVYPQYRDVLGYYVPSTALTVNAGTSSRNVTTLGDGFFEAWFSDHAIDPGDTVSCNMGGARSIIVRDVTAVCDLRTNRVEGSGPANRDVRVTMDPNGTPVVYETVTNAEGDFAVELGALFTAKGSEVYNVTWYDDDGDCVVYEFRTFSWYLAEGYTGGSFDTYVLVQNPGPDDAWVVLSFQLKSGTAPDYIFELAAGTRFTVPLDSLPDLADAEVSTKVTSISGNWVVAERAMYFDYSGLQGGHDSIGTINPSKIWYLAEGYTGGSFDTFVLVQNPGLEEAVVTLSFQLKNGTAPDYPFVLPAGTRFTVPLDALPSLADAEVSTKVTSTVPVVAERSMYFDYGGMTGGHDSIGVMAPSDTWYLAEGYTGGSFDTFVLVQNAGAEEAVVTLSFQLSEGAVPDYVFALAPGTRFTVPLDALPGLSDASVSTLVTADKPVVAERAVYFDYFGRMGGHDSIGVNAPHTEWYLAEGYTGGSFDTYVLVQNAGAEEAVVTLSFQLTEGTAPDYVFALAPGTRFTVPLDILPGLSDASVSTLVTSDKPVVAERAMYFDYFGRSGGHDSVGVPRILR